MFGGTEAGCALPTRSKGIDPHQFLRRTQVRHGIHDLGSGRATLDIIVIEGGLTDVLVSEHLQLSVVAGTER